MLTGGLASVRRGVTTSYYVFDPQANTRALVSQAGDVTDAYVCGAFGQEVSSSGSAENDLRYGGQVGYWRDALEQMYVRARDLRGDLGRWMSRDPLGFEGGDANLYRYVGNGPTDRTDGSGAREQNRRGRAILGRLRDLTGRTVQQLRSLGVADVGTGRGRASEAVRSLMRADAQWVYAEGRVAGRIALQAKIGQAIAELERAIQTVPEWSMDPVGLSVALYAIKHFQDDAFAQDKVYASEEGGVHRPLGCTQVQHIRGLNVRSDHWVRRAAGVPAIVVARRCSRRAGCATGEAPASERSGASWDRRAELRAGGTWGSLNRRRGCP